MAFRHDTRRNPFLPHLPAGCSLLGILPDELFRSLSESCSLVFTREAGRCRVGLSAVCALPHSNLSTTPVGKQHNPASLPVFPYLLRYLLLYEGKIRTRRSRVAFQESAGVTAVGRRAGGPGAPISRQL